jgi:hypothetical protein
MEKIRLKFEPRGQTVFFIADRDGTHLAKLIADIVGSDLVVNGMATVKGKRGSFRSTLFDAMISYAREHYLTVIAINRFVYNKLKGNPEQFADVWDENSNYKE